MGVQDVLILLVLWNDDLSLCKRQCHHKSYSGLEATLETPVAFWKSFDGMEMNIVVSGSTVCQ